MIPIASNEGRPRALVRRAGVVGFVFFLVKGLLWLAIPARMYLAS